MSNDNGRPDSAAPIYKHGRLKSKSELGLSAKPVSKLADAQKTVENNSKMIGALDLRMLVMEALNNRGSEGLTLIDFVRLLGTCYDEYKKSLGVE